VIEYSVVFPRILIFLSAISFFIPVVSHADVAATTYVDTAIAAKEDTANKIKSVSGGGSGITSAATDAQYPSAKAVYGMFVDQAQSGLLNLVYPVGSIYISTAAANPGTLFGGTWEAFGAGRVLVGAGTGKDTRNESRTFAAGGAAGEYNHALTVNELAAHEHPVVKHSSGYPIHTDRLDTSGIYPSLVLSFSTNVATPLRAESTGGNAAHNNIQPYVVVYMWRRTA
jgi:hypothetical protein